MSAGPSRTLLDDYLASPLTGRPKPGLDRLFVVVFEQPGIDRVRLAQLLDITYDTVVDQLERAVASGWVAARLVTRPRCRSVWRYWAMYPDNDVATSTLSASRPPSPPSTPPPGEAGGSPLSTCARAPVKKNDVRAPVAPGLDAG